MIDGFDFQHPDYAAVFAERIRRLNRIRENPRCLPNLRDYYREHPADFINDWGCTVDPRNIELNLPAVVPFVLFPRQREWIDWVMDSWRHQRPGVTPKSRESGVSWLAVSLADTLCLFHDGMNIGFGSRKAEYVDKIGAPKSLFWKARKFVELLPAEFRNGFYAKNDAPEMRIQFRQTDSVITGEGGDNIGRGDRSAIYFVDEAAFLERPELADASLSQTTRCRIDIGTPNGLGNPFHRKVITWPSERVFTFHWRDDPRKGEAWYAKQVDELDPVTLAQEVDIDFAASVEGVVIPSAWVQAAVDAHVKLGIKPTGGRWGTLDIADEGADLNAFCGAHGIVIERVEEWSGKGSDTFASVQKAFSLCDGLEYQKLVYDADGMGALARGDARVINERREVSRQLGIEAFRGSGAVANPTQEDVKGRKNEDYFMNRKAQAWWTLRRRFQNTYRAIQHLNGVPMADAPVSAFDDMISISSGCGKVAKLCGELSQPTYTTNGIGKIVIDKAPEGTRSPNLADAVMMRFSGSAGLVMKIDPNAARMAMAGRR